MRRLLPTAVAMAVVLFAPVAMAVDAPPIPVFWDTKERLAKPDLTEVTRVRFLTTTDFPPFSFLDGSGRLTGFHVDLARAICAELDILEKCQIQALPWAELDKALAAKDGEAIIAGLAITADARAKYGFSRAYLQFPARFVVANATIADEPVDKTLAQKRIGVVADSAHERMLRAYFPALKVVTYGKPEDVFSDLKAGKIDGAFGDGLRLAFWLSGSDSGHCCKFAGGPYLAPEFLGTGLAIATAKDSTVLVQAFDYALQQITVKGTFAELYLRYFPLSFF